MPIVTIQNLTGNLITVGRFTLDANAREEFHVSAHEIENLSDDITRAEAGGFIIASTAVSPDIHSSVELVTEDHLPVVPTVSTAIGTIRVGDLVAGGVTSFDGVITSATQTNSDPLTTIAVTWDALPSKPVVSVTIEGFGFPDFDNDINPPIIRNLSATGMDIFFEEITPTVQDIAIHVVLFNNI